MIDIKVEFNSSTLDTHIKELARHIEAQEKRNEERKDKAIEYERDMGKLILEGQNRSNQERAKLGLPSENSAISGSREIGQRVQRLLPQVRQSAANEIMQFIKNNKTENLRQKALELQGAVGVFNHYEISSQKFLEQLFDKAQSEENIVEALIESQLSEMIDRQRP